MDGHTSYWERPILLPGDTLRSDWYTQPFPYPEPIASAHSFKDPYTIGDTSGIDCTGSADVQKGMRILKSLSDLQELTATNPDHLHYGVCPGIYAQSGYLSFGNGGSDATDGNIRKVVCVNVDLSKNPVQRNPDWNNNPSGNWNHPNHDGSVECVLPRIEIKSRRNWFFAGLSVSHYPSMDFGGAKPTGFTSGRAIQIEGPDASDITFHNMWISCYGTVANGSSHDCVRLGVTERTTERVEFQNSVVTHTTLWNDADMNSIGVGQHSLDVHIVNVTVPDPLGHAILSGTNSSSGVGEGLIIENSSFQRTEKLRIQCGRWDRTAGLGTRENGTSNSRLIDPVGEHAEYFYQGTNPENFTCGCGSQSMISRKHGSKNPNNPQVIVRAKAWGARKMDAHCGGDNGGQGTVITGSQNPFNTYVYYSYFQGRRILTYAWPKASSPSYANQNMIGNVFDQIQDDAGDMQDPSRASNRRHISIDSRCYDPATNCQGTELYTFRLNVFTSPPSGILMASESLINVGNYAVDWSCNTIIGASMKTTASGGNTNGQDNVEIDGADISSLANLTGTQVRQTTNAQGNGFEALEPWVIWANEQTDPVQIVSSPVRWVDLPGRTPTECNL